MAVTFQDEIFKKKKKTVGKTALKNILILKCWNLDKIIKHNRGTVCCVIISGFIIATTK